VDPRGPAPRSASLRVDLEAEALWRGGERVHLRTKTWQVLRYLLDRPGALVTKAQLLDAVWGDVVVSEETLTKSISEVRKALGDDPRHPRLLQTVHGRGFRLIQPIGAEPLGPLRADSDGALQPPALPLEARPVFGREAELAELDRPS